MKTKVIFFDVDGTLQSFKTHKVLDSSREAISKLQEKGIKCVVCTGRHIDTLMEMDVKDIPFDAYITLNGQLVLDKDKNYIWGYPFSKEVKDEIVKIFNNKILPLALIEEKDFYMNYFDKNTYNTYEMLGVKEEEMPTIHDYTNNDIYQAMTFVDPNDDKKEYLNILPKNIKCVSWYNGCVDIFTDNEGKVEGIKKYLEYINIDKEYTMAIGDADNDIEMLEYVNYAIAMGNAKEKVKEIADYITDDDLNDGIYNAFKYLELI